MAEKKKKPAKKRSDNYEQKVSIKATFDEVLNVFAIAANKKVEQNLLANSKK
jgi:hypothetical protein